MTFLLPEAIPSKKLVISASSLNIAGVGIPKASRDGIFLISPSEFIPIILSANVPFDKPSILIGLFVDFTWSLFVGLTTPTPKFPASVITTSVPASLEVVPFEFVDNSTLEFVALLTQESFVLSPPVVPGNFCHKFPSNNNNQQY